MHLGTLLREARERANLSLRDVAYLVGTSAVYVYHVETAQRGLAPARWAAFARVLAVDVEAIAAASLADPDGLVRIRAGLLSPSQRDALVAALVAEARGA